ncbi:lactate utilization protein [uncultured Desulfosarcina sp.]|uniref:lactate utilization protein n=1 Tax=uncultured Desulfosarcina sp. TaxID=218289 RepID=UPI0029C96A12|nr:lactate utilization protein [uncultured Desulfosarcina sp.]
MPDPIDTYWQLRLERCRQSLKKNNFEVFMAADTQSAGAVFQNDILPGIEVKTAAWGDSMTMLATGVLDAVKSDPGIQLIDPFDAQASPQERLERRRQALLTDLFFTGSNAVTETGVLVNLDMVGNRVAGLTFGPKHVVLFIGRNKIVPTLDDAMRRVKTVAAPANAIRHPGLKTPCMKTAVCMDCSSPDRICNTWCITEKCFPKGRIKIILINQDLGL